MSTARYYAINALILAVIAFFAAPVGFAAVHGALKVWGRILGI